MKEAGKKEVEAEAGQIDLGIQSQSEEDVFCASCGYQLHGLSAGQCPECGAPFDLLNVETYALKSESGITSRSIFWWMLGIFLFFIATVIGTCLSSIR